MTTRKTALLASAGLTALALAVPLGSTATAAPAADDMALAGTADVLSTDLGADFGGSWLENGKLVVAVTDSARAGEVTDAGAVAKVVRHSEADLNTMVAGMNAAEATAPDSVTVWAST